MRIIGNDPSKTRQLQRVASGALTDGTAVVVNSDGTVSVPSSPFSSSIVFEEGSIVYPSAVYDTNSNKVVVAYRDGGNSNYGTAVVGTVSGDTITFGTPVVFESANTIYIVSVFDSNSNKVVISYYDGGNAGHGTSIVGTVSGTSISFGAPVVFETAGAVYISSVFDDVSNKVIIVYTDQGNANYGTSVVGTVSGTSISFGTPVVFNSALVSATSVAYDTNAEKAVVFYRDSGGSSNGEAKVGTISGTSISFGSVAVFDSGTNSNFYSSTYDANAQKVIIAYRNSSTLEGMAAVGTVSGTSISFGTSVEFEDGRVDYSSTAYDSNIQKIIIAYHSTSDTDGKAVVGTVSGTSISFASPETFSTASTTYTNVIYNPDTNKSIISFPDGGNSSKGTSIIYDPEVSYVPLTSENYIGISRSGATDTANAIVTTKGGIAENLSGLTAGQSYYVQTDGTLSTTAGDPSVFAGTAVSANKLIVKG